MFIPFENLFLRLLSNYKMETKVLKRSNLLKYDIALFEQLKEKHGFEPPVDQSAQPDKDQPTIEVTADYTSKSVYSFCNGSAGGFQKKTE